MSQTHLKSFRDHEWDLFQSISGVYYLYLGLRRAPKPYFGLILEFWIISLNFFKWIILLNILDFIELIFFWMNIRDFVLNWILNGIIFRPNSMKKWIFKTYRPGLTWPGQAILSSATRWSILLETCHFLVNWFAAGTDKISIWPFSTLEAHTFIREWFMRSFQ